MSDRLYSYFVFRKSRTLFYMCHLLCLSIAVSFEAVRICYPAGSSNRHVTNFKLKNCFRKKRQEYYRIPEEKA